MLFIATYYGLYLMRTGWDDAPAKVIVVAIVIGILMIIFRPRKDGE